MGRSGGRWDPEELPDQSGRVFLVTGATAGLGYFACEQLARAGAHVIMSGRNPNRLAAARAAVQRRVTGASTESILLDVTKSGSVHSAAATLGSRARLDGVILNAGVVHPPKERMTAEGNEFVLQTNVLGHFALAADLLPVLAKTSGNRGDARIVWIGSIAAASWQTATFNPQLETGYTYAKAYVQSKFLVQALAAEADRRLRAASIPVDSVIANPGYALGGRSPGVSGVNEPSRGKRFVANLQALVAQSKEVGAHAEVRALIDPDVESGDMVGPAGRLRGVTRIFPRDRWTNLTRISRDPDVGAAVWGMAEETSRATWPLTRLAR